MKKYGSIPQKVHAILQSMRMKEANKKAKEKKDAKSK